MLQRAANNAYSWWWASHIRTKQSKWLEENLQDMEEKVREMLKIVENDGDSFTQRVEMYYKQRPELISHVQEAYRSYRALAERFNHLSMDLQSANRTIATVFPEQVQYAMDDDDDDYEHDPTTSTSPDDPNVLKADIPKVPDVPTKEFRSHSMSSSKKGRLPRIASSAKAAAPSSSGLSQGEALEEISRLQKEILALQTEKEFVQSVCQRCQEKCQQIENQITGMQAKISGLQDEFRIQSVIDDNEARTLMAATALKSCQETLVKLKEKQEESDEESKVDDKRIKEVHQKLIALKSELLPEQTDLQKPMDEQEAEIENHHDMELLREKIKNELNASSKSSLTVIQLADRIDELVEKVATLEATISSQSALVNRLTSETDGLQAHIKTLEEDKESLMENLEGTENKVKELEDELQRVGNLNESVKGQNKDIQTRLTEASCNVDHLSEKLKTVKLNEEFEKQEECASPDAKADGDVEKHEEKSATGSNAFVSKAMEMEMDKNKADVTLSHSATAEEHLALKRDKRHDRKCLSETDVNLDTELEDAGTDEEEDQPNWRQLFLCDLDEREKLLVEEYTLVLKNYKDVRKKMNEVEKKNRDGFFELTLQIRELKHALAQRDEEIQFLQKMIPGQQIQDEDHGINSSKYKYKSMKRACFLDSTLSTMSSPRQDVCYTNHTESRGRINELASHRGIEKYPSKEVRNEKLKHIIDAPHALSAIEEKFRSDIDEMLEENLEFWLRFSTSFHQIRKFQTSIHDLKVELSKLKDHKRQSDRSGKIPSPISEARPIYKHLREIHTDLSLWLENNTVLKDELQGRYASLCNIQEELSRVSHASSSAEEPELGENQAAKFQGEVLNMKQESNKIADELQVGMDRVRRLKIEVENILAKMDDELGISESKNRNASNKARIPLRSFLFGVKLKRHKTQQKPSIFSRASPALQKQYSSMATPGKLPQ